MNDPTPVPGYEYVRAWQRDFDEKVKTAMEADKIPSPTGGVKSDGGKPRYDLISPIALEAIARVLSHGAEKYSAHNWRKGIEFSRLIRSALGHINAFNSGENIDPESNLQHLAEAGCNIIFLLELCITHPELDDRFKVVSEHNTVINSL